MIQPKYKYIKQLITQDIRDGKLKPGDKLPIRTRLLEIYQTTHATIDKALSELIDEKILVASRRLGTFVAAREQLQRIALVAYIGRYYPGQNYLRYNYQDMYGVLLQQLKERQIEVIDPESVIKEPEILKSFDTVISNPLTEEQLEAMLGVVGSRHKIIPLNRPFEGYDYVSTDHRGATCELTEIFLRHLPPQSQFIFLDARLVDSPGGEPVWELRKQGFIDACAKHQRFYRVINIPLRNKRHLLEYDILDLSELKKVDLQSGPAPACIISPSRWFTGAALRHFFECNLTLNKDVFYADFNNYNSHIETGYAITSVLEDFADIAHAAVRQLDSETRHPMTVPHCIINNPFRKNTRAELKKLEYLLEI